MWAGATSERRSAFWKPGTTGPGSSLDRDSADAEGGVIVQQSLTANEHLALDQQRKQLPIYKFRGSILYTLEKYRTLVIVGETGCGKTTQVPKLDI
jgi:ATP-dependent RNA helicase DDX35